MHSPHIENRRSGRNLDLDIGEKTEEIVFGVTLRGLDVVISALNSISLRKTDELTVHATL